MANVWIITLSTIYVVANSIFHAVIKNTTKHILICHYIINTTHKDVNCVSMILLNPSLKSTTHLPPGQLNILPTISKFLPYKWHHNPTRIHPILYVKIRETNRNSQ